LSATDDLSHHVAWDLGDHARDRPDLVQGGDDDHHACRRGGGAAVTLVTGSSAVRNSGTAWWCLAQQTGAEL